MWSTVLRVALVLAWAVTAAMMPLGKVAATGSNYEVAFDGESEVTLWSSDFSTDPFASGGESGASVTGGQLRKSGASGTLHRRINGWTPVGGTTLTMTGSVRDDGGAGSSAIVGLVTEADSTIGGSTQGVLCSYDVHAAGHASGAYIAFSVECVIPEGAIYADIYMTGHRSWLDSVTITGVEANGDCVGVGSLAMDGGLVAEATFGSQTPNGIYGDLFLIPVLGFEAACQFTREHTYYALLPDFDDDAARGHTFRVGMSVSRAGAPRVALTMGFLRQPGGSGQPLHFDRGVEAWVTSPNSQYIEMKFDAPAGAIGVYINMVEGGRLHAWQAQDIEGSEGDEGSYTDPVYEWSGGSPDQGTLPDRFALCEPPEDAINVPGWLAYGVCIVIAGFQTVVDWISALPGLLAGVLTGALDVVYQVPDYLGGVFGGIVGGIVAGLEWLFLPTSLGAAWADFWDTAAARVPFVYIAEVATAVGGINSSLAGGSLTWAFTIMGAPVAFDAGGVSTSLSMVRPALVGVVWLTFAWVAFHRVGAALGMSRSEAVSES